MFAHTIEYLKLKLEGTLVMASSSTLLTSEEIETFWEARTFSLYFSNVHENEFPLRCSKKQKGRIVPSGIM